MSSARELEFKAYAMTDPSAWSDLQVVPFKPKDLGPEDVEVAITHCGVCGSDVHILKQHWGKTQNGPVIVGHEIVGKVTRVGERVESIRPGDRVGVGGGLDSCHECRACIAGYENHCPRLVVTPNAAHYDGVSTQGGFATGVRAHQRFVFPIPDGVESRHAASMMCAGVSVFNPLHRNGCGPGKKVGVFGVGGLGHYAVLFAKAMGAEVYAFIRGTAKADDVLKMGADHIVDTTVKGFWEPYALTFDIIISTVDRFDAGVTLPDLLSMLFIHGKYVAVGLPPLDEPLGPVHPFVLGKNGCSISGTLVGSKEDARAMLELAAQKKVVPWVEELPMSQAKVALEALKAGEARYRYVLTQDIIPVL
ncbi:GroES-like protein [Trametes punicea]|nr:GroES-like protein [Trametes punicea]